MQNRSSWRMHVRQAGKKSNLPFWNRSYCKIKVGQVIFFTFLISVCYWILICHFVRVRNSVTGTSEQPTWTDRGPSMLQWDKYSCMHGYLHFPLKSRRSISSSPWFKVNESMISVVILKCTQLFHLFLALMIASAKSALIMTLLLYKQMKDISGSHVEN